VTGVIEIVFEEAASGSGLYYGLTWAGDKVTELEALRDAKPAKLDVTFSQELLDATEVADWDIVYDDVTDATYVVCYRVSNIIMPMAAQAVRIDYFCGFLDQYSLHLQRK